LCILICDVDGGFAVEYNRNIGMYRLLFAFLGVLHFVVFCHGRMRGRASGLCNSFFVRTMDQLNEVQR